MALGYRAPLYLMAFDHRGSFAHDLFGVQPAGDPNDIVRAGIRDAKDLIYEGFVQAIDRGAPRDAAGVLVDEEFGTQVARTASAAGYVLAMPVEKSGQAEFEFFYGEDFGAHIERFGPTFAKVLVRYNPDGDRELNARQTRRLAQLSTWLHDRERKFLFELLVPATGEQLAGCGGEQGRYDRELRPELVVRTLADLQDGGVEPDIWKIEGLETADDCAQVVAQARSSGRDEVCCVVLGRGADRARVEEWLRTAAGVPGFDGFAVGRTIWEDALRAWLAGTVTRDQAATAIADRYLELIDTFVAASGATTLAGAERS
ncbi:MAG: 2-deoxy-5-keto-D-gluconate 6-phosphate aldolase domain-containing protein [Actinopolymorphaceae bacterium]